MRAVLACGGADGDLLYIIGGGRCQTRRSNVFEHFNDVHALDLHHGAVEPRRAERRRIPARRGHCAGLHEATRRVFIFGGCSEPRPTPSSRPLSCSRTWILRTSRRTCDGSKLTSRALCRGGGARTGAPYYAMRWWYGGFLAHHPPISERSGGRPSRGGRPAPRARPEHAHLATRYLNYLRTEPPLGNLVGLFGFAALGDRLLMHGGSTGRVTGLLFSMEAGAWLDWYCDDDKRTTAEAPTVPVTLQHTAAAPPLPRFGHELVEAFGHLMIFGGTAATGRELRDIRILRRLPPSPTPLAGPVLLDKHVTMQIHVGDEIDATAISGRKPV